ncbi:CarD family transcriptional regulator [Youngiibacter fragilis]|uniref:CarD family transcriptional regulator n=1 Tax=Youngiibacter fragilis 232.1 TaxID=994573 RepID=V7I889_9CLOT|nr:CarD family transcriptional regulator [Youngiibacter fragilis]ETA81496.1 CarD family transcriptional regulator [Youngiibacter fragilis 232.1]
MFNKGDMMIYSSHGICLVDDICSNRFQGVDKDYYVLHPIADRKLTIRIPVDNKSVTMLELIEEEEAEKIIDSFSKPGRSWIEINNERNQIYSETVRTGNRKDIAAIVNTLMRRKYSAEQAGRKFSDKDRKLLNVVQGILFTELAISLSTTFDVVNERVTALLANEA